MKRSWVGVFYLAITILFLLFLAPKVVHVNQLQQRSRNLEKEIGALKADNAQLENELRLLRTDPVYLEKVAREKFNKAKKDEIVYRVVRDGS